MGFLTVLDISGINFEWTKEISEVCGKSLKFNLALRWQTQGIIYVVHPLNGSPVCKALRGHTFGRFSAIFTREIMFVISCSFTKHQAPSRKGLFEKEKNSLTKVANILSKFHKDLVKTVTSSALTNADGGQ